MKKNKQLLVNMIASLATLAINLIIGFCFTPIVVNKAGGEAYGFVSLSNSMMKWEILYPKQKGKSAKSCTSSRPPCLSRAWFRRLRICQAEWKGYSTASPSS